MRVVVCSTMLACTTTTDLSRDLGPVPDGSLTTDATGYLAEPIVGTVRPLQYQFKLITRFENRSRSPVFLGRCYPNSPQPIYSIVSADGSALESAYNPNWACVGHDSQFQLLPGAVRVDTFTLQGPNVFDPSKQQAVGATSGMFRLALSVRSAPGDGAPAAPGSLGMSNAFVVRTSR